MGGLLPRPSVVWPPGLVLRQPFVVGLPPVCAQWWWFHCHLHAVSINITSLNICFSTCFFFTQNIYYEWYCSRNFQSTSRLYTYTPIPPHKILFKSKSYFSLQLTVYVCLKILEFCLYCKFFYMSYIPVPCLNLSSLDSHKVDSTGE